MSYVVVDSIVMIDPVQKRSRGFGFITYEEGSEGAQKAMAAQPHSIRDKYVEIKYAQPKAPSAGGKGGEGAAGAGLDSFGAKGNIHSEYYGLANAYGRNGWKAGYGTLAFGRAGWNVAGWETFAIGDLPERTGFSFDMLTGTPYEVGRESVSNKRGHDGTEIGEHAKRSRQ